jgi:hypothetical protein
LGSMQAVYPARSRVLVLMGASFRRWGLRRSPCRRADGFVCAWRPHPFPLGSMEDPAAARTLVLVLIAFSG